MHALKFNLWKHTQQNGQETDEMCEKRDWEEDLELSACCWALSVQRCTHCSALTQ